MIYIGNQTSCWAPRVIDPFDYAVAQHFDAFEWFPDKKDEVGWDETDLDSKVRHAICERARGANMHLSVHARWQANPLIPHSQEWLNKDLQLARDLQAVLLNIHLCPEHGLAAFVQAILPLIAKTAEVGLRLAIENTPHHSPDQFNELFSRLRDLKNPGTTHVGMCLDIGHANLSASTRNDYLAFCTRLDPLVPIIHVHLHENWGDADSHLPLFTGPAGRDDAGIRELLARLRQRNFSGSIILEQWPQPPSLLNNARDRLLELLKSGHVNSPKQETPPASYPPEPKAKEEVPADHFIAELTEANRRGVSWREKLEFICGVLASETSVVTADQLIDIAIYLRFLGTGQIACAEDGRHFRPAHHARIASQIQERLAQLKTPENEFVLRKIQPWLPSSAPTFQRPEPLTRIRDIAHRNDIPSDLKREIKTRLQNKLHRCAGPEDLATSAELLERITAEGAAYSAEFVEQFRIFHDELKEFFNTRSLEERFRGLLPSMDAGQAEQTRLFLSQKTQDDVASQLASLRSLTDLRRVLAEPNASGSGPHKQDFILADIALEDFAFVLLSQIINGSERLTLDLAAETQTEALSLSLRNLALTVGEREESGALVSELRAWGKWRPGMERDETLRLRASVLRCRRLGESFGARTIALFSGKAESLGRALGVPEHAIRVFSEADIRSHIVFQVSKLADLLLRRVRKDLGLSPWDVLMPGIAVGQGIKLESLRQWQPAPGPEVAFLSSATGDEEIPKNIVGIVLAHELPHLAHLSVRARQAGVVLVTCEEATEFERLQGFDGKGITLSAWPDQVSCEPAAPDRSILANPSRKAVSIPATRLAGEFAWISLEKASSESAGGKASSARRLQELAGQPNVGFHTPRGVVIPFGVMEVAIAANPTTRREYQDLIKRLSGLESLEFKAVTEQLRELVQRVEFPPSFSGPVQQAFAHGANLIARSSANCEDLEEFAGAGLYESVINVTPATLATAIRTVWTSLWTQRAAESRRAAGIAHEQAHMAVLVQELLNADYSFILHTVNPVTSDARELYAEIVVGLGETLASAATAGTPYRLACDKHSQAVSVLAFGNYSHAARPAPGGGLRREILDYSKIELSRQPSKLKELGRQLTTIGAAVERAFRGPQDIEGAVLKGEVYLVQTRAQQGLPRP